METISPNDVFYVGNRVHAIWGEDSRAQSIKFIRDIDANYFAYIADTFRSHLEGENKQRAALAIRTTYHHALETFFTLVGASIQAPHSVPAWMLKISTLDLRSIIRKISNNNGPLKSVFLGEKLGWEDLADTVFSLSELDKEAKKKATKCFSEFWEELARDWLDEKHIDEYNSIKHGMRLKPGGFRLELQVVRGEGEEVQEGDIFKPPGSEYGSHYYVLKSPENEKRVRNDPHIQLRGRYLNWSPYETCDRIQLLVLSIENIKQCILRVNKDAEEAYKMPSDWELFERYGKHPAGVSSMEFGLEIPKGHFVRYERKTLEEMYDQWLLVAHGKSKSND